jgi:zinc protease
VVTAQTSTNSIGGAASEVVKALNEVRSQGLTPAEVEGSKDHFISSYDLKLETNQQLAERLAEIESYGLGRDYILNYKSRVAAVTADQIRNSAVNLLHPDALVIVAVGPAARIKDELAKLGPVEMVDYDPKIIAPPPPKAAAKPTEAKPAGQPR